MIIYNVTVNVEDAIHDKWLTWMQQTHIPDVMNTGMFEAHQFSKLLTRQSDETGTTYVIQYLAQHMESYERYQKEFAPALQQETLRLFGNGVIAFRTLMETV